jgi:hypothetical protein
MHRAFHEAIARIDDGTMLGWIRNVALLLTRSACGRPALISFPFRWAGCAAPALASLEQTADHIHPAAENSCAQRRRHLLGQGVKSQNAADVFFFRARKIWWCRFYYKIFNSNISLNVEIKS